MTTSHKTKWRESLMALTAIEKAVQENPCPICGGVDRCELTHKKLGLDNLTKEQWAGVYRFVTEVELPFLHSIILESKRRPE